MLGLVGSCRSELHPAMCFVAVEAGVLCALQHDTRVPRSFLEPGGQSLRLALAQHRALSSRRSASLAMLSLDGCRARTLWRDCGVRWLELACRVPQKGLPRAHLLGQASSLANGCFPWPGSPLCSGGFVEAFPRACQSSCQGWVRASPVSGFGLAHLSRAAFGVQLPLRASSRLVLGRVFPAIREVVCVPDRRQCVCLYVCPCRRQCVCLYVCPCKGCFCLLCAKKSLLSS